ncbi:DUF4870 domain-containing protein [Candidatus Eisenbacteria bacterium]|uniref:DUF4870 domain-containing protein n=1 Tax=Eiseniibacteriota bacterium TaxID=2212470 RepID=A0ABV6YJL6_UNCEI
MNEENQSGSDKTREVRKWASLCHLAALVGIISGVGFVVGPLIVWLMKREDHVFIDQQGKEAVNFQITLFIAAFVSGLLTFVIIGLVLLPIALLLMVILPIIAAVKTNDGHDYKYPFTIRFIK